MTALAAQRIGKVFGALQAVRDISFDVAPGERFAIIGPNGAGKTTLFNLLAGVLRPTTGAVLLGGRDVSRVPVDRRVGLGLARSFQRNSLFPKLTVRENLAIAAAARQGRVWSWWRALDQEVSVQRTVSEVAEWVGVANQLEALAGKLAYGVQRQVEVGLALASNPSVLLLDEPTAGMSPGETQHIQALLAGLPRTLTVLIIEHDMEVVFALADRILVMDSGEFVFCGPPEEVRQSAEVRRRYLGAGK